MNYNSLGCCFKAVISRNFCPLFGGETLPLLSVGLDSPRIENKYLLILKKTDVSFVEKNTIFLKKK